MTDPRITPQRTKARKRALDILFEADVRDADPGVILADRLALGEPPIRPFTITLVNGVREHLAEIDAVVGAQLREGWTLARMPRVDRALARIAAFEVLYTDTEPQAAVGEAVTLAGQLSTDDSPGFLNGVLGALLDKRRAARAASVADTDATDAAEAGDLPTPADG